MLTRSLGHLSGPATLTAAKRGLHHRPTAALLSAGSINASGNIASSSADSNSSNDRSMNTLVSRGARPQHFAETSRLRALLHSARIGPVDITNSSSSGGGGASVVAAAEVGQQQQQQQALPPSLFFSASELLLSQIDDAMYEEASLLIPFAPQAVKVSTLYILFTSGGDLTPTSSSSSTATTTTAVAAADGDDGTRTVVDTGKGHVITNSSSSAYRGKVKPPPSAAAAAAAAAHLARSRRQLVRERFRTMKNLLLHMAHKSSLHNNRKNISYSGNGGDGYKRHWGVHVSFDGIFVTRAVDETEAGEAFERFYTIGPRASNNDSNSNTHNSISVVGTAAASSSSHSSSSSSSIKTLHKPQPHASLPFIDPSQFRPEDYCYPIEAKATTAMEKEHQPEKGNGKGLFYYPTLAAAGGPAKEEKPQESYQVIIRDTTITTAAAERDHFQRLQKRRQAVNACLIQRAPAEADSLMEAFIPFFGDDFAVPPPPPDIPPLLSPSSPSSSSSSSRLRSSSPSTFTPQMLVPLLPTYFIPLSVFMESLPPGYTVSHVERIFGEMGCIDLVTLPGASDSFIRLHGGRTRVQFGVSAAAEASHINDSDNRSSHRPRAEEGESALVAHFCHQRRFETDPFLCDGFLPTASTTAAATSGFATHSAATTAAAAARGGAGEWVSLRALVEPAPAHIHAALGPFQGKHSILFFAQHQQRYNFTPDGGGGGMVARTNSVEGASLREETTPTPIAVAELVAVLRRKHQVFVADLEQSMTSTTSTSSAFDLAGQLSDFSRRQIISHYGTLRHFLACHGDIFHCEDAGGHTSTMATREEGEGETDRAAEHASARTANNTMSNTSSSSSGFAATALLGFSRLLDSPSLTVRLEPSRADSSGSGGPHYRHSSSESLGTSGNNRNSNDANMNSNHVRGGGMTSSSHSPGRSLEQKLEKALMRNDRRAAQKARRRLAIAAQPDSPYADPTVLLDAVLRYLPGRRPVSLRYFVKSLPSSLGDFLPEVALNFFRQAAPHKVQLFEWRRRNQLYLMRPGLPLPDGKLRDTYTEQELLYMVAEELTRVGRRRNNSNVMMRVGDGINGGSEPLSSLFSQLPYGARQSLGGSTGSSKAFFQFLQRYPEHFMLVFPDAVRLDIRAAKVTLLSQPHIGDGSGNGGGLFSNDDEGSFGGSGLRSRDWDAEGSPPRAEELAAWRAMDEAAMRERLAEEPDLLRVT